MNSYKERRADKRRETRAKQYKRSKRTGNARRSVKRQAQLQRRAIQSLAQTFTLQRTAKIAKWWTFGKILKLQSIATQRSYL